MMGPATAGHLNPLTSLGRVLQDRGHRVTFVGPLDAEPIVTSAGLGFAPCAAEEYPRGATQEFVDRITTMGTLETGWYTFRMLARATDVLLRHAPAVLRSLGPDLLVADALERSASSIAEHLAIPFVTVCSVLPTRPEPTIPPFGTPWPYRDTRLSRARNRLVYRGLYWAMHANLRTINRYRVQRGMRPLDDARNSWSELAVICQVPRAFDFPRRTLPPHFHYVGALFRKTARPAVDFPFHALSSRPLVYACLGTMLGQRKNIFDRIATACADLDVQLVISLGERGKPIPRDLPGSPLVVDFAPQLDLLERAELTITHAGINTTLESLRAGVPVVAIPLCNDQPGNAARIAWTGTGTFVPLRRLSPQRLRAAIDEMLSDPAYRQRARAMAEAIAAGGGSERAAEIIEATLTTGRPVAA